jgi:hypothetical protein
MTPSSVRPQTRRNETGPETKRTGEGADSEIKDTEIICVGRMGMRCVEWDVHL